MDEMTTLERVMMNNSAGIFGTHSSPSRIKIFLDAYVGRVKVMMGDANTPEEFDGLRQKRDVINALINDIELFEQLYLKQESTDGTGNQRQAD